jgi:hypothetical protein
VVHFYVLLRTRLPRPNQVPCHFDKSTSKTIFASWFVHFLPMNLRIGGSVASLFLYILTCGTIMIPITRAFLPTTARTMRRSLKFGGVLFSTTGGSDTGAATTIVDVCKAKIQAALDASSVKVTGTIEAVMHAVV